jgi:hypothetical protein
VSTERVEGPGSSRASPRDDTLRTSVAAEAPVA